MTKTELNSIIDGIILIKDKYPLELEERENINRACNVIEDNMEILTSSKEGE